MNRLFTTLILAFGLIGSAAAQTSSISQVQDPSEIIELSSYVDGNYLVEQSLVMETTPSNNDFFVHYKINLTKLISSYSNNAAEIAGLRNFIETLQNDSLKRITSFDIVGYSSPDGGEALNKRLANERAQDFCKFVDMECNMADYPRTVTGDPLMWIDAKEAIARSSVPNKDAVIAAVSSSMSQSQIEAELEKHDEAWDYIKENILPPMRYVEISIHYNSWKIVESRTLIEAVEPPAEVVEVVGVVASEGDVECDTQRTRRGGKKGKKGCCAAPADNYIYCMLIEMPGQEIDFGDNLEREKLKIGRRGAKYKELTDGERLKVKGREARRRYK